MRERYKIKMEEWLRGYTWPENMDFEKGFTSCYMLIPEETLELQEKLDNVVKTLIGAERALDYAVTLMPLNQALQIEMSRVKCALSKLQGVE